MKVIFPKPVQLFNRSFKPNKEYELTDHEAKKAIERGGAVSVGDAPKPRRRRRPRSTEGTE